MLFTHLSQGTDGRVYSCGPFRVWTLELQNSRGSESAGPRHIKPLVTSEPLPKAASHGPGLKATTTLTRLCSATQVRSILPLPPRARGQKLALRNHLRQDGTVGDSDDQEAFVSAPRVALSHVLHLSLRWIAIQQSCPLRTAEKKHQAPKTVLP